MNLKKSLIISDMELQDRLISAFLDYHVITVKYTGDKQNNYTSKKTNKKKEALSLAALQKCIRNTDPQGSYTDSD